MSEEENEECFCFIHENEQMDHYRECLNCKEKLCELCIAMDKTCQCEEISEKNKYKKIYITKGEIKFEICQSHPGYQCHYLCTTCSIYVCVLCSKENNHKNHKIILIEDYIQMQSKNITSQKQNIEQIFDSIKTKDNELNLKREKLKSYINESNHLVDQNLQKFSEFLMEILSDKKKLMESKSISEILELKKELLFRKKELEIRKKYLSNFRNFIEDVNNAKLLPFICPEEFFEENINFANEINENINQNKKYFYNKIIVEKKGILDNFRIKEEKRKENIVIEPFNLPSLKQFETPY